MKLTWSEASVFAFVWACALGYIVASRILEWNFERFLPRACLKNKSCTKHIFPRPFS